MSKAWEPWFLSIQIQTLSAIGNDTTTFPKDPLYQVYIYKVAITAL